MLWTYQARCQSLDRPDDICGVRASSGDGEIARQGGRSGDDGGRQGRRRRRDVSHRKVVRQDFVVNERKLCVESSDEDQLGVVLPSYTMCYSVRLRRRNSLVERVRV
jgi:hypothetical protein